jgi:hypothetical protein
MPVWSLPKVSTAISYRSVRRVMRLESQVIIDSVAQYELVGEDCGVGEQSAPCGHTVNFLYNPPTEELRQYKM